MSKDWKELATTWNKVTGTITGTAAAVVIGIAVVNWFQPRAEAEAQHLVLAQAADEHAAQQKYEATRDSLEAELERVELGLKLWAQIQNERELTPTEELEFSYLLERREQIVERLYEPEDDE